MRASSRASSSSSEGGLGHDRLREPVALHADEERRLGIASPDPEVVDEERLEGGVDQPRPLAAALGTPHLQQTPLQVDVVPVESKQLAAAQACVGEEREYEPVALALTVMLALPDVVALGRVE